MPLPDVPDRLTSHTPKARDIAWLVGSLEAIGAAYMAASMGYPGHAGLVALTWVLATRWMMEAT
jgi:hypothetical protein